MRDGVTTWDTIYFGSYCQDDTPGSGKYPIRWRVLSINGDDAFLLADQNLDVAAYDTEDDKKGDIWETCTLRSWLNRDFLTTAFSTTEQNAIKSSIVVNNNNSVCHTNGGMYTKDKVYLLSIDEVKNKKYGFNEEFDDYSETRQAKNTPYAEERGVWSWDAVWWLRSPGSQSDDAADISNRGAGDYGGGIVDDDEHAVRPVLHLSLSKTSLWLKGEKVSSNVEGFIKEPISPAEPTKTPTVTLAPTTSPTISATLLPLSPKSSIKVGKSKIVTAINMKGKKVTITAKKVTGTEGYQVQYACNKKFKKAKTVVTSKTVLTIKKLKKKKTYYLRVRAYKMNGKKKVYGKWSGVKKVRIKR